MKFKALLMTVLFAAGVATSVALAKGPPPGKGKEQAEKAAKTKPAGATAAMPSLESCHPKVAFVLKGELKGAAAGAPAAPSGSSGSAPKLTGSFELEVKAANAHGRALVGKSVTVMTDAKTKVVRRGKAKLEDLEAGDSVQVHARSCKAKKQKQKQQSGTTTTTSTTTSTDTTGATPAPAAQPLLLAKQVVAKPQKNGSTGTSSTSTGETQTAPTQTETAPAP